MKFVALLTTAALLFAPMLANADEFIEELDRLTKLAVTPLNKVGPTWVCRPKQLYACGVDGCQAGDAKTEVRLDFLHGTYSRCDQKGCDQYPMTYEASGVFTTAQPNSGAFLKVLNDGSEYMEVATLGLSTLVYFGSCEAR